MGYDLERFDEDIDDDFICPICLVVLQDPVYFPKCDHTFCRECINRSMQLYNQCPLGSRKLSY